jgi:hypothetical protein
VRTSRVERVEDDTIYYNPAYDMNFGVTKQGNKDEYHDAHQGEQVANQSPTSIVLADIEQTSEQAVPLASRTLFNKAFQVYDKKVQKLTVRTPLNDVGIRVLGSYLRREAWQALLPTIPQTASLCLQLSQLQMEDKTLELDCVRRVVIWVEQKFATCKAKTKTKWAEQTKGVVQRVMYKHFKSMLGLTSNLEVSIGFILLWYPWMEMYVSFMFSFHPCFALVGPRLTDYSVLRTIKNINQITTRRGILVASYKQPRTGRFVLLHVYVYKTNARNSRDVVALTICAANSQFVIAKLQLSVIFTQYTGCKINSSCVQPTKRINKAFK